ncbi:MAG TPA: PA domain-containing protein, partial [Candidatus Solibacter sp.]|nr:PA domain-containing protein [Candidatus Solibacter sp.]
MSTLLRSLYIEIPWLAIRARTRVLFAVLALALVSAASPQTSGPAESQRYLNDIKALTTPAMEGRGDGTKGLTRAAHLIEQRYKSLGLEPAGIGSYFQPFTVITGARLKGNNHLRVHAGSSRTELKLNQDFVPFSFSSSGSVSGPVVFVGYGASAGEFGYDDYQDIDVKDKIVLLLRYEPSGFSGKSGNHGLTQHSQLITKAINARNHGAKAVVLINGKLSDGEEDLLTRF